MEAETGESIQESRIAGDTGSRERGRVQTLFSLQEEPEQLVLHFGRQASRTIRESSCVVSSYTQFATICYSIRGKLIHPLATSSSPLPPTAPHRPFGEPEASAPSLSPPPSSRVHPHRTVITMLNR